MNLFKAFESRVSDAFGGAPQGYVAPISFRRLAKSAAKQMEAETLIIDGVDTAPALYTVLVSPSDDIAMRPLYPQLTQAHKHPSLDMSIPNRYTENIPNRYIIEGDCRCLCHWRYSFKEI